VERKINDLVLSKKTKSHIKMQMHRVFDLRDRQITPQRDDVAVKA
jgi:hypothetical protein